MKLLSLILTLLLASQITFGQFQSLDKLIPPGFTILDSASGDFNRDSARDLIVILKNNYEDSIPDTTRPLLLLLGNSNQQYMLLSRNDSVVLCKGCGGAFGDPYQGITIKNGYFSIEHLGGSRWRWTRIITFKYDLKSKQFILHRDAGDAWDDTKAHKSKEELYNKEDFDKLAFDKYSNDKNW